MLDLLNAKKQELEEKLILLGEAIGKTEAKLELVIELIKEEESKAQTFAEASCEANPVAAEAEKPAFDPLVEQEKSTIYIKYSNEV